MEGSRHGKVGELLAEDGDARGVDALSLQYRLDDVPPVVALVLFGAQHVLIMFSAMVASPLVIGQLLGLSPELRVALITAVMLGCGIGTLVSALGVGWIGARLPLLLGAYAVYIGPVVAIAKAESLGAATADMLIGGFLLLAVSPLIAKLRSLFPPIVVGALLVVTGLSLMKIAMNVALGVNTPFFGRPMTVIFLVASIVLITIVAAFGKRTVRSLSILLAMIAVYGAGLASGLGNFSSVADAPWFRVPTLLPYGLSWPGIGGLITIAIYHLIAAIYTMSITIALCAMIQVDPRIQRIRGAIAGDGLGSIIAVLFGGVPLISYDQNVGAISLTGVASRYVVAVSGMMLVGMAFLPKIGAVIGMVPPFVLGGTLVFMFGMIAVVGIRIIAGAIEGQRDTLILAATLGLSVVVNMAPSSAFDIFPPVMRILAADGIVVGTVVSILLNQLLPRADAKSGAGAPK